MEQQNEQEENNEVPGLSLGIDFGNSKISAAIWDIKRKEPSIVLVDGKNQFPSTLYFKSEIPKKENQENQENQQNENLNINDSSFDVGVEFSPDKNINYFIYDLKKLLGQKKTNIELENIIPNLKYKIGIDNDDNILYDLEENYIRFDELVKILIEKIKKEAENQFNDVVNYCTISVPHSFNNNQRMAIKAAAFYAGIKNVFIINEPLSTAIYYASQNKIQSHENILIIDLGSSKLDISIISINSKNAIKIKAFGGDSTLGGDAFNFELQNEILNTYKFDGGTIVNDSQKFVLLDNLIEKAKKDLTFQEEAEIKISKFDGKTDLNYLSRRQSFNEINHEIYARILKLINDVINESKIPLKEISHILLQGDGIRVVGLTDLIKNKFQDIDIITDLYDSIAYGNAIYTARQLNMMNNKQFENFKIYDITPISLGIRTEGDLMSVILPRGSRVPIKAIKRFNTTQDNQSNIKFEIYEGERKLIQDNRILNRIILKNLPLMNKKEVKVEICFEVDEEFILTVTATELTNKFSASCKVVINEDLSQTEILKMIEESKECEEKDKKEKDRIKAMLKLNDKIFEYCHLYDGNEDILRELEGYRTWIKHNPNVPKEEYEKLLKEINDKMGKGNNKKDSSKKNTAISTK